MMMKCEYLIIIYINTISCLDSFINHDYLKTYQQQRFNLNNTDHNVEYISWSFFTL